MRYRLVRLACLAAAAVWVSASPAAQAPETRPAQAEAEPSQQPPVFRSRVDSVSVDVIVTARDGRPVTDLTPEDFEIREGGELQKIDTFRLVESTILPGEVVEAAPITSLDRHREEVARDENRLFVIFLDDYHTRLGNSMRIRQELASFVRGLSSRDLVALAAPLAPVSGLLFSRDHDAIANEIMAFHGRKYDYTPRHPIEYRFSSEPPAVQERLRNEITIAALKQLCEYIGTVRDGRKALLYVSEGMSAWLMPGTVTTGRRGRIESQQFFESAGLMSDLRQVFVMANRTNTAIYTLDPRGLASSDFGAGEAFNLELGRDMLDDETNVLRSIAGETDGRAIVGENDPLPQLRQMVRDSSTYYLMSYTSSRAPRDGRFHRIDVRVNRRDVQVRARKGYWAYSEDEVVRASVVRASAPAEVTDALEALATAIEPQGYQTLAFWMGARRGPADRALVSLAWKASPGAGASAIDRVDQVRLTVQSNDGATVFEGLAPRTGDADAPAGLIAFEAPAGPVTLHVVGENAGGTRVEARDLKFDVPDFSAPRPQIATPVLFRGRTVRDLQQIREADAPQPVVGASFFRSERVLVRFAVYGPGGVPPTVTLRLLNRTGEAIADLPAPQATSSGMLEFEMGFSAFPPGDYLLEIAAESNGEAAREVVGLRVTG